MQAREVTEDLRNKIYYFDDALKAAVSMIVFIRESNVKIYEHQLDYISRHILSMAGDARIYQSVYLDGEWCLWYKGVLWDYIPSGTRPTVDPPRWMGLMPILPEERVTGFFLRRQPITLSEIKEYPWKEPSWVISNKQERRSWSTVETFVTIKGIPLHRHLRNYGLPGGAWPKEDQVGIHCLHGALVAGTYDQFAWLANKMDPLYKLATLDEMLLAYGSAPIGDRVRLDCSERGTILKQFFPKEFMTWIDSDATRYFGNTALGMEHFGVGWSPNDMTHKNEVWWYHRYPHNFEGWTGAIPVMRVKDILELGD
jgi:hypothetical protein